MYYHFYDMRRVVSKRKSFGRRRASFKRRGTFLRKSYRKGYKPRTSLKWSRSSRAKKAVGRSYKLKRSSRVSQSFINKVRAAVTDTHNYDSTTSAHYSGAVGQAMYVDPNFCMFDKTTLTYINSLMPTTNTSSTGGSTDSPITNKYTIHKVKVTYSVTNMTTLPCTTELYYCHLRRDTSDVYAALPSSSIIQGFSDQNAAVTVSPAQTPFQSQFFTTWWKVTKKRTIRMLPGQTRTFVLSRNYPITMNMERIAPANNATEMTGYSFQRRLLFRTLGDPVTSSSDTSAVSYCEPSLAIITRNQATFSFDFAHNRTTKAFNLLPTIAPANQQHVSVGYNGVFTAAYA